MGIDLSVLEQMAAMQKAMEELKKTASEDLRGLIGELEAAIAGWGMSEVSGYLNKVMDPTGWACEYIGLFRPEVEREILRRINNSTSPNKTTELNQETIDKIGSIPDINVSPIDVRRTIRGMVASGLIATFNPDGKKGRNSTYCLAPVVPSPDTPVDPATITGGHKKK